MNVPAIEPVAPPRSESQHAGHGEGADASFDQHLERASTEEGGDLADTPEGRPDLAGEEAQAEGAELPAEEAADDAGQVLEGPIEVAGNVPTPAAELAAAAEAVEAAANPQSGAEALRAAGAAAVESVRPAATSDTALAPQGPAAAEIPQGPRAETPSPRERALARALDARALEREGVAEGERRSGDEPLLRLAGLDAPRGSGDEQGDVARPLPAPQAPAAPDIAPSALPESRAGAPGGGIEAPARPYLHSSVSQVDERIQWLSERGGGSVKLQLYPPELGRVDLAVRVRGDTVDIRVVTEKVATETLMLAGRELLGESLASRELRIDQFVVMNEDRPGGGAELAGDSREGDGAEANRRDGEREQARGDGPGQRDEDRARPRVVNAQDGTVDLRV